MPLALRVSSSLQDGQVGPSSYRVPVPPGIVVGDLLLFSVGLGEPSYGVSALVSDSGDPARFTDLLTNGFVASTVKHQYVLNPGGGVSRLFWWLGWKYADSTDLAAGTLTVNVDGSSGGGGIQANVMALSGAAASSPFHDSQPALNPTGTGTPEVQLPSVQRGDGYTISGDTLTMSYGISGKTGVWIATVDADDGSERVYAAALTGPVATTITGGYGLSNLISDYRAGAPGGQMAYDVLDTSGLVISTGTFRLGAAIQSGTSTASLRGYVETAAQAGVFGSSPQTYVVTLPTYSAGDLVVIQLLMYANDVTGTFDTPAGWTLQGSWQASGSGSPAKTGVFTRRMTGSEGSTVTFSHASTYAYNAKAVASAWSSVNATPVGGAGSNSSGGGSTSPTWSFTVIGQTISGGFTDGHSDWWGGTAISINDSGSGYLNVAFVTMQTNNVSGDDFVFGSATTSCAFCFATSADPVIGGGGGGGVTPPGPLSVHIRG